MRFTSASVLALALTSCSTGPVDHPAGGPGHPQPEAARPEAPAPVTGPEASPPPPPDPVCLDAVGSAGRVGLVDPRGEARAELAGTCTREYVLTSTQRPRALAPSGPRTVRETDGGPALRSTSPLLDALYALALEETREASVDSIRDGGFRHGAPVPCPAGGCFETGALWPYVWTRDTAYATHLGLAALDPPRAAASLLFKTSDRRGGGAPEIMQDTGTGGGWPVSSDRVAWAYGAGSVLEELDDGPRAAFAARAEAALSTTLERDRLVVFDPDDGLYRGETSFLDWREQTYPPWTAADVGPIASSKALSTNVAHLTALRLGARLAGEAGDAARAQRFAAWAEALAARVHERFFLADVGAWASVTGPAFDGAAVPRFDALGTALAVLAGVGGDAAAARALAHYPWASAGPPVVFPEDPHQPAYHDEAVWPFVTAYMALAAKRVGHADIAARAARSLLEGAALNLSNMENFELATGLPHATTVNSARQLWSVGAFHALVQQVVFGEETHERRVRFRPFLPAALRREWFPGATRIALRDAPWRGRRVTVVLHLPADDAPGGAYAARQVRLDGKVVGERFLEVGEVHDRSVVEIDLGLPDAASAAPRARTVRADVSDDIHPPPAPTAVRVELRGDGGLWVSWNAPSVAGALHRIYRDGVPLATTDAGALHDAGADPTASHCYAVETERAGLVSHRARPVCYWGPGGVRVRTFEAPALRATGGHLASTYGRAHLEAWGDPGHSATLEGFTPEASGPHLVQIVGGNGAGAVNTGITCGVVSARVEEVATGRAVAAGHLVVPHLGTWNAWTDSTTLRAELAAGTRYRIVLASDPAGANLSAFEHFADYTGGLGGASGPFHRVNVAALRVLALRGGP